MSQVISVGSTVKPFTLDDQFDKEISMASLAGKKFLLSFHPLAWTGICTKQMLKLDEAYEQFEAKNTISFGLSVDASPSKKAWGESMKLKKLQLLCDFWPHGGVAESLGIFRKDEGISERANILLDEHGKAVWVKVYEMSVLPDFKEILDFLR